MKGFESAKKLPATTPRYGIGVPKIHSTRPDDGHSCRNSTHHKGCDANIRVKKSAAKKLQIEKIEIQINKLNDADLFSDLGMFGLSHLSVWWLRLGIELERIKPGHPEQNGRHERMHLTLKKETTKPAGENLLQQQEKFDKFIHEYNFERPHQALEMKCPGEIYKPSTRIYDGLPDVSYPMHDKTLTVTHCGRICLDGRKINFSRAFAGQNIGIKQVDDKIWLVSFMNYDLGYFDEEAARVEPGENPFGGKVLPMSSV